MKKIIMLAFFCLVFAGCEDQQKDKIDAETKPAIEEKKLWKEDKILESGEEAKKESDFNMIEIDNPPESFFPEVTIDEKTVFKTMKGEYMPGDEKCPKGQVNLALGCSPSKYSYEIELDEKYSKYNLRNAFLVIYPIESFKNYLKEAEVIDDTPQNHVSRSNYYRIENLNKALREQKDAKEASNNFFPSSNSPVSHRSHSKFIDFKSGRGVRALYGVVQAFNPPTNGSGIFYQYMGISDDGEYLIVFYTYTYSLSLEKFYNDTKFPEYPNEDQPSEVQEKLHDEMKAYIDKSEEIYVKDFVPTLSELDVLVESIELKSRQI